MPRRTISYRKIRALEDERYGTLEQLEALDNLGKRALAQDATAFIPGTGPEKMIFEYLRRLGVRFAFQYHQEDISGTAFPEEIFIPDFQLLDYNTIIEIFGFYWHSIPHRRESDLKKWARQLYGGKMIIEHGIPTYPEGGGYDGKYIIWWDYEIYQSLPFLFTRDLPELFSKTIIKGKPEQYIGDREQEEKIKRSRRAALIAGRIRPRIDPFRREQRRLRKRQFDITKIYPILRKVKEDIYFGLPRELVERRGRKKKQRYE